MKKAQKGKKGQGQRRKGKKRQTKLVDPLERSATIDV
jgi:hypothetical protein